MVMVTLGPSPLSRGSLPRTPTASHKTGSIPALAGQPQASARATAVHWVHPRSRGAAICHQLAQRPPLGPSPLSRGSHSPVGRRRGSRGSIPALAGQPTVKNAAITTAMVHPRSRGAATKPGVRTWSNWGPSPLSRGSRLPHGLGQAAGGSIPALAGQPVPPPWSAHLERVHPRSRGAARYVSLLADKLSGPSPLSRGSRRPHLRGVHLAGSIPALAGQPRGAIIRRQFSRVHPRSRGAAVDDQDHFLILQGPSPLSRGSQLFDAVEGAARGSIPALAGQPGANVNTGSVSGVHPRSRGAAATRLSLSQMSTGPSPLSRGSPASATWTASRAGSIPALAGQPPPASSRPRPAWVHPRSRGAAGISSRIALARQGPSPLSRGSQPMAPTWLDSTGSIPALAGQPPSAPCRGWMPTVHPRSRGAARPRSALIGRAMGPSPLSRGSPQAVTRTGRCVGSIPALAGQPSRLTPRRT